MSGEPSLIQIMYDSIADIKKSVEELGRQQSQQMSALARIESESKQAAEVRLSQSRTNRDLQKQFDDLEEKVNALSRTGWILGILGACVVAIAVGVTTESLNKWMDRRGALPIAPSHLITDSGSSK